jgi:hypothetical protein
VGEKQNQPLQVSFNASLKVDFQRSRGISDGDLILIRMTDERLDLEKLIEEQLSDSRQDLNKQFTLTDLLRQSVYICMKSIVWQQWRLFGRHKCAFATPQPCPRACSEGEFVV